MNQRRMRNGDKKPTEQGEAWRFFFAGTGASDMVTGAPACGHEMFELMQLIVGQQLYRIKDLRTLLEKQSGAEPEDMAEVRVVYEPTMTFPR